MAPRSGPINLEFEAFDIAQGEVDFRVNWNLVTQVAPTAANDWGERQVIRIPRRRLRSDRPNMIAFVARGKHPNWRVWGVRNVRIAEP